MKLTFTKTLVIAYGILLVVILWLLLYPTASGAGAVCPDGTTKYEIDNGYVYGAEDIQFTLSNDNLTVTWFSAIEIAKLCIKIGSPNGGEIVYPDAAAGSWTSEKYAISHVVGWLKPNAIIMGNVFGASAVNWLVVTLIGLIVFVGFCLCIIWSTMKMCGRLDDDDEQHHGVRRS